MLLHGKLLSEDLGFCHSWLKPKYMQTPMVAPSLFQHFNRVLQLTQKKPACGELYCGDGGIRTLVQTWN